MFFTVAQVRATAFIANQPVMPMYQSRSGIQELALAAGEAVHHGAAIRPSTFFMIAMEVVVCIALVQEQWLAGVDRDRRCISNAALRRTRRNREVIQHAFACRDHFGCATRISHRIRWIDGGCVDAGRAHAG